MFPPVTFGFIKFIFAASEWGYFAFFVLLIFSIYPILINILVMFCACRTTTFAG